MYTIQEAKKQLDMLIKKARVDMYKPIQIAEVLRRSRLEKDIDILDKETYRTQSRQWRDLVTDRLLNKVSTSSSKYQDDIWTKTAMPPEILSVLDQENKRTEGGVEHYIYRSFGERQSTISSVIEYINKTATDKFSLKYLLELFVTQPGIRRSIDKAYEIVAYSLFETIVVALDAEINISIPPAKQDILNEFSDLAKVLLGIEKGKNSWGFKAHIYRVGVTNAADRGLDMWANFGPAIQIKHLTLNPELAQNIVDQIESDHIVIVCRDADVAVIKMITTQISWGQRVRGIVCQSELINWYDLCLRGKYAQILSQPLINCLSDSFRKEFPHSIALTEFLAERNYPPLDTLNENWRIIG